MQRYVFFIIFAEYKGFMTYIYKLLLSLILASVLSSCSKVGNLSVTDYKVVSASAESMRSFNGEVSFTVENRGGGMKFDFVKGDLLLDGRHVATFSAAGFEVPGKTISEVPVSGNLRVDDAVGLSLIVGLARNFDVNRFTVNLETDVRMGLFKKKIKKKNLPLSSLVRK